VLGQIQASRQIDRGPFSTSTAFHAGVVLANVGKCRFAGSQRLTTCRRTAIQEYQETIDLIVLRSHWCGLQSANKRRPTCSHSRLALVCSSHLQAWEMRDAALDAASLGKSPICIHDVTPPDSVDPFDWGFLFYIPNSHTTSDLLGTCRVSLGLQLPAKH
jgi:hypothetical protein